MNGLFPNLYFHHLAMNVENYDECLDFYLGMGMKIYCEWTWDEDIPDQGFKKGYKNCFLDVGNGPCLELHQCDRQTGDSGKIDHFCFHVDDVDAVYKRAIELGARPYVEPFSQQLMCSPKPILQSRVAHFIGPAGEQVEIICWNGYSPS